MLKPLNAIGFLGVRQAANLVLSLIRVKILALLLGPAGVGLVSQAINLMNLFWGAASSGPNQAVTVLTAKYIAGREYQKINRILITSFIFLAMVGGIIVAVCSLFSEQIAHWAFGNQDYAHFVNIITAASWIAVQLSLITAIFRALMKIRAYTFSFVLGFLFTIITTIFLIRFFGLTGAILSILVGQIINYLIASIILKIYVLKQIPEISILRAKPNFNSFLQVQKFFGPLLLIYIIMGLGNLILRGEIIRRLGEDANGYYQVAWGLSLAYMAFIEDTKKSYLHPKISSNLKNQNKIDSIQNNMLRINLILLSPFLITLAALRDIWIPILYSREFLMAGSLLMWQFAGDLLVTFRINITALLIPKEKFGYLILEKIIFWVGWIGLSIWWMPQWRLIAVPLGYFTANLVLIIVSLIYQQLIMNFRLSKTNLCLIFKLLPLVAIGFAGVEMIESLLIRFIFALVIVSIMLLWLPDSMEKHKATSWFRNQISSFRQTSSN